MLAVRKGLIRAGVLPALVAVAIGAHVRAAGADVVKPSVAPVSWELKFAFADPQRITLTLPGDREKTTFWYMLYTVENDTGREVPFFPTVELVTQSLQVVQGGEQISPIVYKAITERHKETHPFLIEPARATGTLLQGEDNAKNSMVVFRQFNLNDNAFSIFFSGLSGEIKRVSNPAFEASKPESASNLRMFSYRKTLQIKYQLPGDVRTRATAQVVRIGREWMMR